MKQEYESPVLEIFSFNAKDEVMNSGGCGAGYNGPVCPVDGKCIVELDFDVSGIQQ